MVLALSTFAANIETDRTWYLAGEAMKVSVTDDNALIAYAELCDTHGLAAGVVVGLEEGKGTGIIELPSDLHSGYYVLSVYTNHNPNVTHRLVAVVNPLRKSEDDDIEWVWDDTPTRWVIRQKKRMLLVTLGRNVRRSMCVRRKAISSRRVLGMSMMAILSGQSDLSFLEYCGETDTLF